jgi:Multisubunit Na+/H+ antiporter, MnhE subunit
VTNRNENTLHPSQGKTSLASYEFFIRLAVFSIIWLLLTEWQLSSLIVGSIFIVAASLLSLYLAPKYRHTTPLLKSPKNIVLFLGYFSVQSVRSGWDIAKLALIPKSKTSPGIIHYRTKLIDDSQVFTLIQILNLLPGTVSACRDGQDLSIHVLDLRSFKQSDIDDCQWWVTQLIGAEQELQPEVSKS